MLGLSEGVVPAGHVSAARTAVASLDYNLASLNVKRGLHMVQDDCSGRGGISDLPMHKTSLKRLEVSGFCSRLNPE